MAAFVVDASLASAWCFPDEETDYTKSVLSAVSGAFDALAPRLWNYEIRNSVLMGVRRKRISSDHAGRFLAFLKDLQIFPTDPPSYDAVFTLADKDGLTVYDAAYLDLALREQLPLATLDKVLRQAAMKAGIVLFKP